MIARYTSAITSSTLVTFGLLFVMQLLITLQPGATVEPRVRHFLSPFKMLNEDTPVQQREKLPPVEELTKTVLPPARPELENEGSNVGVSLRKPEVLTSGGTRPTYSMMSDGPLVVLVRVAPVYPANAEARGLEGYVIVEFDVLADGRVANAMVIESSHSIFDAAAVKAAERFKFKPRVVDGVALTTRGIQNLFRFNMEDR